MAGIPKMTMEMILRPFVEHPKRRWIVTIGTFLIAIAFVWPAVDYYFAAAEQRGKVANDLLEASELASKLGAYAKQLEKKTLELEAVAHRSLTADNVEQFRDGLVEHVKQSGCTLRRVKLAEPVARTWYENDNPLETKSRTDQESKTPFKLRQQQLSLQVSGGVDKVSEFLARLGECEEMLHTVNFQLRRSTEDPRLVEMDMELVLFGLVNGEQPAS